MTDFASLGIWALVAGLIAGVVVHWNVARERRAIVVRWCLAVGLASVAIIGGISVLGVAAMPTRAVLGLAFIGFPALVAGLTVLVLGRITSRSVPGA